MDVNFSQIIYYKGKLLGRQLDDQTNEFLYVHFQKRNVLNEVTDVNEKIYFVTNTGTSENGIMGIGFSNTLWNQWMLHGNTYLLTNYGYQYYLDDVGFIGFYTIFGFFGIIIYFFIFKNNYYFL
ncbi:hypothetical protein BHU32_06710 [Fructilactobacillus sanfranciscensis DSM 20451]|nr:hypothetical protein BHU32_06710 [Fructilactobacillus sanfranciscensis DSM 20451]